jgi:cytochrome b561
MNAQTSSPRYGATAIGLHWLMAALLLGLFCVGVYMHDLPLSPWKLRVFSWHKWAGVTAFLLVLARGAWRLTHRPPELPASMTPPLRLAAHVGHALLYLLMVAIPLSGWLMSSAKGFQTVYFAVLPIPDLVGKDKVLGEQLLLVHQSLNFLLAFIVAGHAAAALKHHFVDKDEVLRRMLPRVRA